MYSRIRPAAGVTLAASFPALACADVVYSDIDDIVLIAHSGDVRSVVLDINADGVDDLWLAADALFNGTTLARNLTGANILLPETSDGDPLHYPVLQISPGTEIGPTAPLGAVWTEGEFGGDTWGIEDILKVSWPDDGAYLGLRFRDADVEHFGYVHLSSIVTSTTATLIVHDFAFESDADTPIIAGAIPAPATLALLSLAAAGAARRLRRETP